MGENLTVAAVFVGEEHAVGVAFREEAGLFEGHGWTNPAAFADDAHALLGGAVFVNTTIKQHAAAALRTGLFW